MSKKVKVSYEMVSVLRACEDYWTAKNELQSLTKDYDSAIQDAQNDVTSIHNKRMALVVNAGKTWAEVIKTEGLTDVDLDKKEAKVEELKAMKVEVIKPYASRMAEVSKTIDRLGNLYPAYKLAMINGDFHAKGKVMLTKTTYAFVDTCFHDAIVGFMREYGCGINSASAKTIDSTMFVRIGGKPTKNGFEPFSKRQFMELFIDCVLQYAIDTKQL